MSTEWLTAQSFQHGQDLLTAINTVSIQRKLQNAGLRSSDRARAAEKAAALIAAFLDQLEGVLRASAQTGSPVTGLDSRRRNLAERFVEAKRRQRQSVSPLFRADFSELKRLLFSGKKGDQQALIECMGELRAIVEKHVHQDALRILGEF